ncbi:MAG TPA: hypothetical protein VF614_11510 [Chthoniobacteraceae bacterium]|jgi:hypothetical protein
MQCPLCRTTLPDQAQNCTACDWVREPEQKGDNFRHFAAVWLSLVPGLGHLYKGHVLLGGLVFFIISPLLLGLLLFLAPGTLGLSLLVIPLFLGGVMFHAFQAEDVRTRVIRAAQEMNKG